MSPRFHRALAGEAQAVPPIWLMRQAGRYQQSYQALRRRFSFETMCRDADVASRVAMNALDEFDFDAAILFSDLLFPLDALGLGLTYDDQGPHLARQLTPALLPRLTGVDKALRALAFQAEAVLATRQHLPADRGLIGFVGGPWTLFVYAVEGSHGGSLVQAKTQMPLYRAFTRIMRPLLTSMIGQQLEAGADMVMVFDTAAGELAPGAYHQHVASDLAALAEQFPGRLGYYGRSMHPAHFCGGIPHPPGPWAGAGIDWRWNLADVLRMPGRTGFVQGNFDPTSLHLSGPGLRRAIGEFLAPIEGLSQDERRGWICGLGHGVLPGTPEDSVRMLVRTIRRVLA